MDILIVLLAIIAGFLMGVVVNALADAMPYYRRPRMPRYLPPTDMEELPDDLPRRPWMAWSGVVAFLAGYRFWPEDHRFRVKWRHPIVEIFLAVFFAYIVLNWPDHERTVVWMSYLGILMLITVIDIEHYLILIPVIVPACVYALVVAVIFPESDRETVDYLIGGALGGGLFMLMFWGGGLFAGLVSAARGKKLDEVAFGFGDVMLATLCGLMIGWQAFIFAVIITVFAGAAGALVYMVARLVMGERYSMFTALPYGPYIVLGTVALMLWREEVKVLLGG